MFVTMSRGPSRRACLLQILALGTFAAAQEAPPRGPAAVPEAGAGIRIVHEAVGCVLADAFPQIEARFEGEDVARARLRFRGEGEERWYSVLMFQREGVWSAVLPKPKASLKQIHYALEATDHGLGKTSSEEFEAIVVRQADACGQRRLAGIAVSPPLISVEVPEGTRSLPGGFSAKNVMGTYASGKAVKGHPRTALLAVAGAGAVAGGLTLLKNDPSGSDAPAPPDPSTSYVRLAGSSPGPGSTISLGHGSLSMTFDLYLPLRMPAGGEVTVVLYAGPVGSSPGCVTLAGRNAIEITEFTPTQFTVSTPFVSVDQACGASFSASLARVTFSLRGTVRYHTGPSDYGPVPDVPVSYRFEP